MQKQPPLPAVSLVHPVYDQFSRILKEKTRQEIAKGSYEHLKQHNSKAGKTSDFPVMRLRTAFYFRPPFVEGNGRNLNVSRDEFLIYIHCEESRGDLDLQSSKLRFAYKSFDDWETEHIVLPQMKKVKSGLVELLKGGEIESIPELMVPVVNDLSKYKRHLASVLE